MLMKTFNSHELLLCTFLNSEELKKFNNSNVWTSDLMAKRFNKHQKVKIILINIYSLFLGVNYPLIIQRLPASLFCLKVPPVRRHLFPPSLTLWFPYRRGFSCEPPNPYPIDSRVRPYFGNRVCADVLQMKSHWIRESPKSNSVLRKE